MPQPSLPSELEKVLRACGIDESMIEQLRLWDRAMFNSDRRFYEKLQDTGTYIDSVAASEAPAEIYAVEDLLNDIENAELLKALLTVDKLTLQITLLKMNGYSTNEIRTRSFIPAFCQLKQR